MWDQGITAIVFHVQCFNPTADPDIVIRNPWLGNWELRFMGSGVISGLFTVPYDLSTQGANADIDVISASPTTNTQISLAGWLTTTQ